MEEATAHAICIEVQPRNAEIENFNKEWPKAAEVEMAPVPDDSIKYGSLAGGHTTWVLRAIAANCACTDPKLGDGLQFSAEVI